MKICKKCKEPKFEFQMYKPIIRSAIYSSTNDTGYCKQCIKQIRNRLLEDYLNREN